MFTIIPCYCSICIPYCYTSIIHHRARICKRDMITCFYRSNGISFLMLVPLVRLRLAYCNMRNLCHIKYVETILHHIGSIDTIRNCRVCNLLTAGSRENRLYLRVIRIFKTIMLLYIPIPRKYRCMFNHIYIKRCRSTIIFIRLVLCQGYCSDTFILSSGNLCRRIISNYNTSIGTTHYILCLYIMRYCIAESAL